MSDPYLEAAARKVARQIQKVGGFHPFDDLPEMAQEDVLADARVIATEAVGAWVGDRPRMKVCKSHQRYVSAFPLCDVGYAGGHIDQCDVISVMEVTADE